MLSNNTTLRPLGSLSTGVVGQAGKRATAPCYKNVKTLAWHVKVTGRLRVQTANAAAIVDTGSILSVFDECGVNDGQDRMPTNPLDERFLSEAFSAQALPAMRATALAVGDYDLSESFTLYGAFPYASMREEVSFIEHNPSGDYYFYIKQTGAADGGASRLATAGGGGTVLVDNVVVTITQEFVALGGQLPIFQPRRELDIIQVNGASSNLPKPFLKNYYLQGMLWRQDIAGAARVSDIINAFSLLATNRVLVGDEKLSADEYQQYVARELAGSIYKIGGPNPYLLFWFQRGGRLGKIIRPNDPNFRAVLDVQASASAGQSEIQIQYFLLDRDETVRTDGTRVTKSAADLAKTGLRI